MFMLCSFVSAAVPCVVALTVLSVLHRRSFPLVPCELSWSITTQRQVSRERTQHTSFQNAPAKQNSSSCLQLAFVTLQAARHDLLGCDVVFEDPAYARTAGSTNKAEIHSNIKMLNSLQELLENAQMPASNEVDQSDVVCMTAGRRRRAHAGAGKVGLRTMKALVVLLLLRYGPPPPVAEALKLSAIKDDRGHVGLGLLRAVEVVRGRYERAWALVSSPEPSADDLDAALDLLQVCVRT